VKILKLKTKNKNIELGRKFLEEDDWLNGLTVTVQNISEKAIARIEIGLAFPPPKGSPPEKPHLLIPMGFGREPEISPAGAVQKLVLPGESVEIKLPDANVLGIKAGLEQLGYPEKIAQVEISVKSVTFVDGSEWRGDEILYPNPNNPKEKINPNRQQPEPYKPPQSQPSPLNSQVVRFLNVGLKWAHAPARKVVGRSFTGNVLPQIEDTLPCDKIFIKQESNDCGPVGEGCKLKRDTFVANPTADIMWQVNSRSRLAQVYCTNSDFTQCTPNATLVEERLPCKARIAGTCFAIADWIGYPSSGCITGLFFQGPCTRSEAFRSRCADPSGYDEWSCSCPDGTTMSPIVIDIDGSGFSMTDASAGVVFNMLNDGIPLQVSWTAANSTNTLLVLDRNGNGIIDNGTELFGDVTPQPASSSPNGFLALAEYDKSENGGNSDGKVTGSDAVFSQLRLWQDANHNGISESSELRFLAGAIDAIDLKYKEAKRTDEHGNQFRYRAKVYGAKGQPAERWAWDVFLTVQ
jgi:hypothetical protein